MATTKADIELAFINAPPGIVPPDTTFESYVDHNVINISNTELNEHQVTALEKGLSAFAQHQKVQTNLKYGTNLRNSIEG